MKTLLIILALLLVAPRHSFAGEVVLNMENLVSVYRQHSKQAEPERLSLRARKKEEGHFFRSFLPSLEGSYARESFRDGSLPRTTSTGWNVEGRLSLFNGGRDWLEERVREARTSRADAERRLKDQTVLLSIRRLFWSMKYSQSLLGTIDRAMKDNDTILKSAERRIRAGIASSIDRLEFRLNGIRLRQDYQRAQNEIRNVENELRALLMIPAGDTLRVEPDMTDDHDVLDRLLARKGEFERNPTFSIIQAQAEIELNTSGINSRWYLPRLDLYTGYAKPTLREDEDAAQGITQWYTGVALKFDFGDVASSIVNQQARNLDAEAQLQLKENTRRLNEAQISALAENIRGLHELFHDAETSVKEAEGYVTRVLVEYDRGTKNSIDALNATRQSYDARREGLQIMKDYKVAIAEFQNTIGDETGL